MEESGRRAQSWNVVGGWGVVPDTGYVRATVATKSAKVLYTQHGAARRMPALPGRLLPNGNTYGYASLYTSVNYLSKFFLVQLGVMLSNPVHNRIHVTILRIHLCVTCITLLV